MLKIHLEKPFDLSLGESLELRALGKNEIKVKIQYGGICGSDLSNYKGLMSHATLPITAGHEVCGTVIETGENVDIKVGTRVVIFPNTFCGECDMCRSGNTNVCYNKKSNGINLEGLFAQEVIIDSKYAIPVPEQVPFEKAVLVEPFSVVVHAFNKVNIVKGVTTVAVMGCGPIGLLAILLANYLGAKVTGLDINTSKLDIVRGLGSGIKALNPNDVQKETFDIVIETSGAKSSAEKVISMVKTCGELLIVGLIPIPTSIIFSQIVRGEINIRGSIIYTLKDFNDAIKYLTDLNFNIRPVISKIYPLAQFRQAYEDAMSGNYGKIVLNFQKV